MTIDPAEMARDTLVLVLGDQLTPEIAALRATRPERAVVLMVEAEDEGRYVKHHKQKIAFVLSAMRHFADELKAGGWTVDYVALDEPDNTHGLTGELARAAERHGARRVLLTEPGEWRLKTAFAGLAGRIDAEIEILPDDRFLCAIDEFRAWAQSRESLVMEDFYRMMRRRTGLLMDGDGPAGGHWNYDAENRKPAKEVPPPPDAPAFAPDETTRAVIGLVEDRFADHFGRSEAFAFPVTRADAEAALDDFVANRLPRFGDYQDAMLAGEPLLYHSLISPALNAGLLDPMAVCHRVEAAWRDGEVPLNAAEGFIRQILGWREFVRGVYWLHMPDYLDLNHLGAERPLPEFYWTAETDMACLRACLEQTRDRAYAHHIQRLMITGNFAMLAGVEPAQIHDWYLCVYADAYEWVELPNTLGMSQYADGGIMATKPYAAGGNYIRKMSDYCSDCRYDVRQKTGAEACPFNYLYWDFVARHAEALDGNRRMTPILRNWAGMDPDRKRAIRASARRFLDALEPAKPGWARD